MRPVVWLPALLWLEMQAEADEHYPIETGGTFMGYWADSQTALVTGLVPAGPNAARGRTFFAPDQEWQLQEIAKAYEESGRRHTYLGDWHTHPDARSGVLSATDRSCLRTIIEAGEARCPHPLMILMSGAPTRWRPHAFVASLEQRLWVFQALTTACCDLVLHRH